MIGYVGLSHLGIVSSIAAAAKGFGVIAYDPDRALTDDLSHGFTPIHEANLQETLAQCWTRISFTSNPADLEACEVIFISLDLPTDEEGNADVVPFDFYLSEAAVRAPHGATLVVLSQVRPGTTRNWAQRLAEECPDVKLYYQAETLVIGSAVQRALQPERFILGCADSKEPLARTYVKLLESFDCPILPMSYESAELAKIAINVYLASSVSVTNTLAELCEAIGADWNEITPALRLDRRIGPHAYLSPGPGITGGNLERDLASARALAEQYGTDKSVIDGFLTNSTHRRDWTLRTLREEFSDSLASTTIAIWGLAYKSGTSSIKNSPALSLLRELSDARIQVYDPLVSLDREDHPNVQQVTSALAACQDAQALVILTACSEFESIDLCEVQQLMEGTTIIDPLGVLDGESCQRLGFTYLRMGQAIQAQGVAQ